jgi:excisionase family DNA binding protein
MSTHEPDHVENQGLASQSPRPHHLGRGLTITEAGQRLGRSSVTIRQWIAAGKLRAEVVQRPHGKVYRVYLDEADVEALRRAGVVPAPVADDTDQVKGEARASQTIDPNQPLPGLSIREASKRLGRSRQTIRRWIATGKLRAEVFERPQGKVYRVYLDEPAAEPPTTERDVPANVVLSFMAGLRAELERRAAEVRERDATIATLQRDVQDLRALTGFLTGVLVTWTRPPTD